MRPDIEALLSHITLQDTVDRFGDLCDNHSKVVCRCIDCQAEVVLNILGVKNHVKKRGCVLCNSCIVKRSWRDGSTRQHLKELWDDPNFRERQLSSRKIKRIENKPDRPKVSYNEDRRKQISECSKQLWQDPEYRKRSIESKKKLWQDPEYRKRQEAFKTREFREKQSLKQIEVSKRDGYRERQSNSQKRVWMNEEYRKNCAEKQKSLWTDERRRLFSEIQKRTWKNNPDMVERYRSEEYRKKLSNSIRNKWKDESFREKCRSASKVRWTNLEYRRKMICAIKKMWNDQEYRRIHINKSRAIWKDENFVEKMGKTRSAQSGAKSSIEVTTEKILDGMGIKSVSQLNVGPYLFDYFLPDHSIYIECQGEYWHSIPGRQARDAAKFTYLEKARPESKILYLYERDFCNPAYIASKIRCIIFGENRPVEIKDFSFDDVVIKKIHATISSKFLDAFHYARHGRSHKLSFGAYLGEELIAVCKFSTVVRKEVATSMSFPPNKVMELDRFCIHPAFQKKNFASWFLSRATRSLFEALLGVSCLVSFADLTYGHFGTIYKAANWKEIGTVAPDYHYVNEDGYVLHKKTLYNHAAKMSMKEREYAELHKYKKVFGKEKTKFAIYR